MRSLLTLLGIIVGISGGIYFYRVQANDYDVTKKMLLMK
jgi:hypothetical protein